MKTYKTYEKTCQELLESLIIGLSWNEIKSIFDDDADTLTHQIYSDKAYWQCIFNEGKCIAVRFAFSETS